MGSGLLTFTNLIVALTCAVSLALMDKRVARANLIFHPVTIREHGQWYRFLSSGLVHADMAHLLINMFVLWSFGSALEAFYFPAFLGEYSTVKFLLLYFGGIAVASLPSYFRHKHNPGYAALGASGGVSAVVFAVILFAPWQNLYLWGVLAIPQIVAGAAYLYYSWYADRHASDNIGHMAHFTGAVWGFIVTGMMNPDLFVRFLHLALAGPDWLSS